MLFFLIFLIIPLTEIGLFMAAGDAIGFLNTLILCFITAVAGSALVRYQGIQTLASAQSHITRHELPVDDLFTGICLLAAGLLLITPGFFTDFIGFSLLVPPLRMALKAILKKHFRFVDIQTQRPKPQTTDQNDVIEGDYERIDTE